MGLDLIAQNLYLCMSSVILSSRNQLFQKLPANVE